MQAQAHARNMIQEQNRIVREWVVMAPQAGLEPATQRLTVACSTN